MMEKLLTYALKDSVLTHVLDVPNGKECGCLCPKCLEPLVAKANIKTEKYKKEPHFAHSSGSDCPGAYESALHLLAKKVLSETKQIQLPDFHIDYNSTNEQSLYKSLKIMDFDDVLEEQTLKVGEGYIVADVECRKGNRKLFVEFANTHFVDSEKKRKIKNENFTFIEIDLSGQVLDFQSLKNFLLTRSGKIYWIYNPVLEQFYLDDLERKAKTRIEENNRTINHLKNNNLNVIQVIDRRVRVCPKKIDFYKYFNTSKFLTHPILIEIINGEYWNEILYGSYPKKEFIIYKEKVIHTSLYPGYPGRLSENSTLLRKGLKEIIERNRFEHFLCGECMFSRGSIKIDSNEFQLCSFKLESGLIKDVE
jgi:hypothetical protein